jgi:response regulator of citrate/malate metabolism
VSRVEKKLQWTDEKFKRQIGTTKKVFLSMLDILQAAHVERHKFGGNPNGLTVGDKLLITLRYYRHYDTMESIGDEFGRSKSTVCRYVQWVEDTLSADGRFQLPGKKALQEDGVKTVGIDVMEHPIERPKVDQGDWYSGKKNDIR